MFYMLWLVEAEAKQLRRKYKKNMWNFFQFSATGMNTSRKTALRCVYAKYLNTPDGTVAPIGIEKQMFFFICI